MHRDYSMDKTAHERTSEIPLMSLEQFPSKVKKSKDASQSDVVPQLMEAGNPIIVEFFFQHLNLKILTTDTSLSGLRAHLGHHNIQKSKVKLRGDLEHQFPRDKRIQVGCSALL